MITTEMRKLPVGQSNIIDMCITIKSGDGWPDAVTGYVEYMLGVAVMRIQQLSELRTRKISSVSDLTEMIVDGSISGEIRTGSVLRLHGGCVPKSYRGEAREERITVVCRGETEEPAGDKTMFFEVTYDIAYAPRVRFAPHDGQYITVQNGTPQYKNGKR